MKAIIAAVAAVAVAPAAASAQTPKLTTLVSFCAMANCADGSTPFGPIAMDAAGNLFGTTENGGTQGLGTLFEIVKTGDTFASTPLVLVNFAQDAAGNTPGEALVIDVDGNIFGTTTMGGAAGYGTVYELANTGAGYAASPTVLASFDLTNGREALSGLTVGPKGNPIGTTEAGGTSDLGTIFELQKKRQGYVLSTLVNFTQAQGRVDGSLVSDVDGNLFGTTELGGAYGYGSVFKIPKMRGGTFGALIVLASFNLSNGAYPNGALQMDAKGNIFGTTAEGGNQTHGLKNEIVSFGTVFELPKIPGGYASAPIALVKFCSSFLPLCTDGAYPQGGVQIDAAGNLFGVTFSGGTNGAGTIFKVAKLGKYYDSTQTVLANFGLPDGSGPAGGLRVDAEGNLFGTTEGGGANFSGTVFELTGSGIALEH